MKKLKFSSEKNEWLVEVPRDLGYPEKIQGHNVWLERFQVDQFFYLILTPASEDTVYCSPAVKKVLGYEIPEVNLELLLDSIHPEDLPVVEEFEAAAGAFLNKLAEKDRWSYKIQYNLRLRTKLGPYKHVMFQRQPLRTNDKNKIETLYIFTDLSSIKTNADQYLSLIHLYGGPSKKLYRKVKKAERLPDFSELELQVLEATLVEGDVLAAANRLKMSLDALRNHLGRMRKKTGTKTTVELLSRALEKKWT